MSDFIRKQTQTAEADRPWTVAVLWTLRIILALTILAEAAAGDLLYAAEALLALALCSLAGSLLKAEGGPSPLDVEIVLLLMAVGNCTLGVAGNLYRSLPYYDKFLHVANPLALAFYCLPLLAGTLDSGRRNMALALAALTVLAITGASAVWEILEYASDELFMSTSQGSPTMMPLDDTMWDLMLSFLGALVGVFFDTFLTPLCYRGNRSHSVYHLSPSKVGKHNHN